MYYVYDCLLCCNFKKKTYTLKIQLWEACSFLRVHRQDGLGEGKEGGSGRRGEETVVQDIKQIIFLKIQLKDCIKNLLGKDRH